MPQTEREHVRSLFQQAATDAADAADRLYSVQRALRALAPGLTLPVEASEVVALQRRAQELAEAFREIGGRRGW